MSLPPPLLRALGIAMFDLESGTRLRLVAEAPGWLPRFWPDAAPDASFSLDHHFPFLLHFIDEAIEQWRLGNHEALTSEIWTEQDTQGRERLFKATALLLDDRPMLLLQPATIDQNQYRILLQNGRDLALNHHHLRKAVAQREVMLHCVAHDFSTPLAGIRASLKLLTADNLVDKAGEELVALGLRQIEKLQELTRQILNAVSAPALPATGTDIGQVIEDCVDALLPLAGQRQIGLRIERRDVAECHVTADKLHLERVIFNLVDNAIRHAPDHSTIVIRLVEEGGAVYCRIDDEGKGVPPARIGDLFEKYVQGDETTGQVGLGLYFCRITVEGWGGQIGYTAGARGGACFWFKLPKAKPIASELSKG